MNNFTFYSPTCFSFGKDAENNAGALVKRFGGAKVLIHYGGGSVVRSGLLDRVKASLDRKNIPYAELGGVKPNPRSGLVYEGIELCKKEHIDFILAVGGGSTIDSSKAIAAGAVYDGDFWDFYCGKPIEKAL
ncbi:MAG: iron-containing alcohol dehydrogenase, partial [Ruminococcus sp.]|nr:iron-containing alcohol dehydrogenase [Ruminococcus sp.]